MSSVLVPGVLAALLATMPARAQTPAAAEAPGGMPGTLWLPQAAPLAGSARPATARPVGPAPAARPPLPPERLAGPDRPGWVPAEGSGCRILMRRWQPGSSLAWSGACLDGMAEGPGRTEGRAGTDGVVERAEGIMRFGQWHGPRILSRSWPDGRRERVEITEIGPGGRSRGEHLFPGGSHYVGEMLDLLPDGQGSIRFGNGSRYEGGWKGGQAHGMGRLLRPDGRVHAGLYQRGCLFDGSSYVGVMLPPTSACRGGRERLPAPALSANRGLRPY